MKRTYPRRSRRRMHYHGRVGYPVVHRNPRTGRTYVMVRKKGGGVKRLYRYNKYLV